jgi:hypothetical protein
MMVNPYESPQTGAGTQRSRRLSHPFESFAPSVAEALVVGAMCVGAFIVVPFLYVQRSGELWTASIVAFGGVPLIAGLLWKRTYRFSSATTSVLFLTCPIIYALTDPLPALFEIVRDASFLATSSMVIFVSAASFMTYARSRRWGRACAAAMGVVCGAIAVCVITALLIYLE